MKKSEIKEATERNYTPALQCVRCAFFLPPHAVEGHEKWHAALAASRGMRDRARLLRDRALYARADFAVEVLEAGAPVAAGAGSQTRETP